MTPARPGGAEAARPAGEKAVRLSGVTKVYGEGDAAVTALNDVTWEFPAGSFTAVMGPSGSGKTTLLQMAAGLAAPTRGEIHLGDTRIDGMPERRLAVLRRERVGFVFQSFNLIPALTARENILLPMRLARAAADEAWLAEITGRAGITDRLEHYPDELSGGQQQRVALCRALLAKPALICGDEPTGALDSVSSRQVMTLLREAVDAYGQTFILVTHDPIAASYADRVLFLVDGTVAEVQDRPGADRIGQTLTALVGAR